MSEDAVKLYVIPKIVKLIEALEKAKFTAYEGITADERQLHGNVCTVVNLETAKAIVKDVEEWRVEAKKVFQEMLDFRKEKGYCPIGLVCLIEMLLKALNGEKKNE